MELISFWKFSNFNVEFKNAQQHSGHFFCFWDTCIWIGCVKLFLLGTKYLSSAVNVWINSLKILDISKRDVLQLNYHHSDQKISLRRCRWDWNSVSAHLACSRSRGPLKRGFLDIYLTTSLRVRKFGNT